MWPDQLTGFLTTKYAAVCVAKRTLDPSYAFITADYVAREFAILALKNEDRFLPVDGTHL